ncbi:hypothetical protein Pint_06441 [Pistacia integerrima]|uniref:Uncharacterized protein n=1 Tax=Pistacia integerrima TaxID=434235 RepID=A0ACC0Z469_9ROSI|nr:hypothetical protein Pint_06441 [Pistacia integerrima]
MASSRPPPPKPLDLDLTIVSAKHLKNVNWRLGDLKPYCVFWVDQNRRLTTRSDDSGSTRPVWNDQFTLPLTLPFHESMLAVDIFHSILSETPKPLVATLRVPLKDLPEPYDCTRIRTFELLRPSGRPQGKIRVKIGVRERPLTGFDSYQFAPPQSYYYNSAPPSHYHPREYREFSRSPPAYTPYFPGYGYSSRPPQSFYYRTAGGYLGSTAPVDYSTLEQRPPSDGKRALGTGLAVGAVAGALGGLTLEERLSERSKFGARGDYSGYYPDY